MAFEPIFIDTETVGLHGLPVLIQWSQGLEEEKEINLFSPWTSTVSESLNLIRKFINHPSGLVFFNAAFDWFQIYKWYTICLQAVEIDPNMYPEDNIDLIIELEESGRDCPNIIKPIKTLDLFLHARQTKYQSTMDRKDIIIRKVPTQIAWILAEELEKRVLLKDIYFARRKDKHAPKWQVQDRKDSFGEYDPDWKNIVVRFKPSSALKALAVDIGLAKQEQVLRYGDISPKMYPVEFGYAPFAKAAIRIRLKNKSKERHRTGKYRNTWPDYIKLHIIHWGYNELARKYASDDIVYTRGLFNHFNLNETNMGDVDSELAIMVACVRWRGYRVDLEGIKELKKKAINKRYITSSVIQDKRLLPTDAKAVKRYIMAVCDENEKLAIQQSDTKKVTLEELARGVDWQLPCTECIEFKQIWGVKQDKCDKCGGKEFINHPACIRAKEILESRKAGKEEELYDKLLAAGRLHASLKVIGTLSGRMSGADGLNVQAVKNTFDVKSVFLFGWPNEVLCGGDFEGFEVTIAEAEYNDPELRKDLTTCESCNEQMIFDKEKVDYICPVCHSNKGKKIHALFGTFCFPPLTYDEIKASEKTENDLYTKSKQAVFLMIYGGDAGTMQTRLGIPLEAAEDANRKFNRKYKGVGRAQEKIINFFQSMRQPGGRGTKVEWHEPADYIETMYGFRRYFTLENMICKALYTLANNMPRAMKEIKIKVTRTDRMQTAGGAACSAIYSAAFNVQGHNKRAATNHVIQGTGAKATKLVQKAIWDIQPSGEHTWRVQPLNIHDSILTPTAPEYVEAVEKAVKKSVEEIRPLIPLIKMPWENYLINWADKDFGIIEFTNNEDDKEQIINIYKNRYDVLKFNLDFIEVYKCLTKQIEQYNGHKWRLMTKDENVQYKKSKNYRKKQIA